MMSYIYIYISYTGMYIDSIFQPLWSSPNISEYIMRQLIVKHFSWQVNWSFHVIFSVKCPFKSHLEAQYGNHVSISHLMHRSSSRQEYRPSTGVRPAKGARKNTPAQYPSPGTEATHILCETSYQAAYSGQGHRSRGLHQGGNNITSAASSIQPAAGPQPTPTATAGWSPIPSSLQQSVPPEMTEFSRTINGEVGKDRSVAQMVYFLRCIRA